VGSNPTITYVYDTNGSLPVLLSDGARKYVYGPAGLAYAVDSSNNVTVYHTDGLGSVRALTNGSGTLLQTYQTNAFGNVTQSQGTVSQPFGFTGQQVDGNGLVYLRARYYNPSTGRLLSRNPMVGASAAPPSLNRYRYGESDPVPLTDPSGRMLSNKVLHRLPGGVTRSSPSWRWWSAGACSGARCCAWRSRCSSVSRPSFGGRCEGSAGLFPVGQES